MLQVSAPRPVCVKTRARSVQVIGKNQEVARNLELTQYPVQIIFEQARTAVFGYH